MECLYCGYEYDNKRVCPACGTDTAMMKKIYAVSAKLYNKGLERAKNNDFCNAADCLEKSVYFNKQNVDARNLLGLVYYKTGRLADAVREWIISTNFKEENNAAADYIQTFQENIRSFEKLNNAVKLYNHAIKYLKKKNDDVAVIRLKKALDINPGFVDASNLLTLCYIKQEKWQKALEAAEKTLEIDSNNPVALRYLKEISNSGNLKKKFSWDGNSSINYTKAALSVGERAMFIALGAVCAAVVMGVLIIPANNKIKDDKIEELNQSYTQLQNSYNDYAASAQEQIDLLEDENSQMKSVVDEYSASIEEKKKADSLNNAKQLLDDGKIVEAANAVAAVDMTGASDEELKLFNEIKSKSYAEAAEIMFDEGKEYSDAQDYENAKNSLNMCITFSEGSDDLKYSSYYLLGKIAMNQNDIEAAKNYFTEVKNNHPSQSMKNYADNYLKTLQ